MADTSLSPRRLAYLAGVRRQKRRVRIWQLALLIGLFGAMIGFGLQWLLYNAISTGIAGSDTLQILRVVSFEKIWWPVAAVFLLAGVLVGIGGSLTAIRKFLRV